MRTLTLSLFMLTLFLLGSLQAHAQNGKEELLSYGEFESKRMNQDRIQALVAQGALDRDVMWELSDRFSYDIPSILIAAVGFAATERSRIKKILREQEMLTPTVEQLLSLDEAEWRKIPESMRYTAICYAAVKDHLQSETARLQIIDNLQTLKFGDYQDHPLAEAYRNGEASLEALLDESTLLSQLETGEATSDEELYPYVQAFFAAAFSDTIIQVDLAREGNIVNLTAAEHTYTIDLDYVKYLAAYPDRNPTSQEAESPDTFIVGQQFYSDLLKIARQIGADVGWELFFDDLYEHEPPYAQAISDFYYSTLVELCPLLRFEAGSSLFVVRLPKENYELYTLGVGTSFDFHPGSGDRELKILEGILSNMLFEGSEFLTTPQKEELITFLQEEKSSFDLQEEELDDFIFFIRMNVFPTLDGLLQYVPNVIIQTDDMGYGLEYNFSSARR